MSYRSTHPKEAKVIGENLKRILDEHGYSQKQIADKAGVLQSTVSVLVNGIGVPTALRLYRIAKALGCTVEDLMEGVDEPE